MTILRKYHLQGHKLELVPPLCVPDRGHGDDAEDLEVGGHQANVRVRAPQSGAGEEDII